MVNRKTHVKQTIAEQLGSLYLENTIVEKPATDKKRRKKDAKVRSTEVLDIAATPVEVSKVIGEIDVTGKPEDAASEVAGGEAAVEEVAAVEKVPTDEPVAVEKDEAEAGEAAVQVQEGNGKSMNRIGKYVIGVGKDGAYGYFGKVFLDNGAHLQVATDTKFHKIKHIKPVTQDFVADDVIDYFDTDEEAFAFLSELILRTEHQFFAEMDESRLAKLYTDVTNVSRAVSIIDIIRCAIALRNTGRYDNHGGIEGAVDQIESERRLKRSVNKARVFNTLIMKSEVRQNKKVAEARKLRNFFNVIRENFKKAQEKKKVL